VANPGRYNINVIKGTTFNLTSVWKINNIPVIMTGYSADMQVRDVSNNLITEMSTGNGKATITGSAGEISCDLTAAQTARAKFLVTLLLPRQLPLLPAHTATLLM